MKKYFIFVLIITLFIFELSDCYQNIQPVFDDFDSILSKHPEFDALVGPHSHFIDQRPPKGFKQIGMLSCSII